MSFLKKRRSRDVLALALAGVLILQSTVTPAFTASEWNKIVLVDVSQKSPVPTKALISKMRELLPETQSVLSGKTVEELLSRGLNRKSPELIQTIRHVDESLEKYYAYESGASETVLRLTEAMDFIRSALTPSRQVSQLLISAVVMASWLEFKQGAIEAARKNLKKVVEIAAQREISFDYYPSDFRKFVSEIKKNIEDQSLVRLIVESDPAAVNIYVNNVYAGVAPLSLALPTGEYNIGWEAHGRESVVKKVKLTAGRDAKFRTKLSWSKGPWGLGWITEGWHKKMGASQMALAARVAELTQADVAVFVDLTKVRGGYVAAAKIYNARFSQLVETIYSKRIRALEAKEVEQVSEDLVRKIAPYLKSKELTYWSKGVDRNVIVDYRVASRGKKPLYKKPAFWMAVGGVVVTGVTAGILISQDRNQDQEKSAPTGGIILGF